ncbi:MAG: glycosyltransferase family 39 protein [Nitrospira sp.]|nr:glycosyltransferase family 39 protein [Nitrospira sp.]
MFLESVRPPETGPAMALAHLVRRYRRSLMVLMVGFLVTSGFLLRLQDIDYKPLGGDEVAMLMWSQGVLAKGYPHIAASPRTAEKVYTTSEIVPYPMALSMAIFGANEFGLRLPGAIFGALTIALLYLMGRTLFHARIGLFAAVLYTFLPYAINMSQFARYVSQVQFFAILTGYLFYKAINSEKINAKYLYLAAVAYIFTYLSWEGSSFFLLGLFMGLVAFKRRDFTWLKNRHLWQGVGLIMFVVVLELVFRKLANVGHLRLGTGTSDISITPQWLQPMYDPYVYVSNFLFMKNINLLTFVAAIGLPFAFKNRTLGYLYPLIFVPLVLMTNLLEVRDFRHVYYTLPFLILLVSHASFAVLDWLAPLGQPSPCTKLLHGLNTSVRIGFLGLLIVTSNDYVLKLYEMPGINAPAQSRLDVGDNGGIRVAVDLLRGENPPAGPIVSNQPHMVSLYYGKADYYVETRLQIPVFIAQDEPIAIHRITGSPLIYTEQDLKSVLDQSPRAWFLNVKEMTQFYDQEFVDYVEENMPMAFEDRALFLYRWRH